jgi:AcrR family transcriptional regulator
MKKKGTGARAAPPQRKKLGVFDKGQKSRRVLISKAAELFSQYGYEGTTLEAIASASGFTRAVPYRYFDSKRALYLCCLEEAFSRLQEVPEFGVEGASNPVANLEAHLRWLIELFATDQQFRKFVLRSIMEEAHEIIEPLIVRFFSKPIADLARRIEQVNPYIDARTTAYSAISIIVIDLETRKFGSLLKPQPQDRWDTGPLLREVLSRVYQIR